MNNINLIELYQQVFGYTGIRKLIPVNTLDTVEHHTADMADDYKIPAGKFDERSGSLGTPYFMPTKLDDLWLPNEPLVTINGQNTIVKTVLVGIKGTVKELIGSDDYSIKIQGIIINEKDDDYPETELRALRTILEKRDSVKVFNRLLTFFGIDQVAIEGYSFPGIEGYQHMQPYEITCISDWPLDLILKDPKKPNNTINYE